MRTRTELLTDFTTLSNDNSSANQSLGRTLIDMYIKRILGMKDWVWNRGSYTDKSLSGQWIYPIPYNAGKIRGIRVQIGTTNYWPKEVLNREDWALISRSATTGDAIQYYFVDTNNIEFYPSFSTADNPIDIYFQKVVLSRSASDYTTGLISRSAFGRTVWGKDTTFTWPMVGRFLRATDEDEWYEISDFINATQLLTARESRTAVSSETYVISEVVPLPDYCSDLPLYWALETYFQQKENPAQAKYWQELRAEGINQLLRSDSKTTGNILERQDYDVEIQDPNRYPLDLS